MVASVPVNAEAKHLQVWFLVLWFWSRAGVPAPGVAGVFYRMTLVSMDWGVSPASEAQMFN